MCVLLHKLGFTLAYFDISSNGYGLYFSHLIDMKKYSILALVIAMMANLTFTACDTTNNNESEPSRDCIISSATLGTLKRQVHSKTAEGKDTVLTYTVTGGSYNLYIDQVNYRIYNPEPLPYGTLTNKLVFATNGLVNSGYLTIKSLTTGNDTIFTPTDSTDFSVKREVTVHAEDGVSKRTYTIDIRAYDEEPDSLVWHLVDNNPLNGIASFVNSKALTVGGMLYVFGQRADGTTQVVETETATPHFDNAINITGVQGLDVKSIQYFDNNFYAISADHKLVKSATGNGDWTSVSNHLTFNSLVAVSNDSLYAVSQNKMMASADGVNWNESATDTEGHLPINNVAWTLQQSRTSKNSNMLIVVADDGDSTMVWKHDFDNTQSFTYPWMFLPRTNELGGYACPRLKNNCLFVYDGGTILTGVKDDGTMAPFYTSQDNGRTWKANEMYHPTLTGVTSLAVTVDQDQYIWIICSGSGSVYKGRINRLGWK